MLAATKLDSPYKTEMRGARGAWRCPATLVHLSFPVLVVCSLCWLGLKLPPSLMRGLIYVERLIREEISFDLLGSSYMSC